MAIVENVTESKGHFHKLPMNGGSLFANGTLISPLEHQYHYLKQEQKQLMVRLWITT